MGDSVIPLPYLQSLRKLLPETGLDFLTLRENSEIPKSLVLFDSVYDLGGGRSFKRQAFHALSMLPRLLGQRYDVVLDLQNNEISRAIRRALRPLAWSEFDRYSPVSAGDRTKDTIAGLGLGSPDLVPGLTLIDSTLGRDRLEDSGWDGSSHLVVLNPAGFHSTRNWPLENYAEFADLWLRQRRSPTQFLVLGLEGLATKAHLLRKQIGPEMIDLVGRTTAAEAFAILQKASFVLTEDSGLMHMAWVSGIPTLALFGSSRSDWSRPLGDRSLCLNSSDLPCGACMEPTCLHGDVRCLTRYNADFVFERAERLLRDARADGSNDVGARHQ